LINEIKNIRQHVGFMKYFRNTSLRFFEKILRMVVGLFVGIWVARYLGPEELGILSFSQAFVGIFSAIATLGLDGIVIRELVKDQNRRNELIGTAFWLKLLGSILVLLILAFAIRFTSNDEYTNFLIFIIAGSVVFQSLNVVDFYFQSKVLSGYIVFANTISLFFSSILKIVLILNEAPLIAFAWLVLFDSVVLAIGFIACYLKEIEEFRFENLKFKKQTAKLLLKDSWPLILSGLAVSIYIKIDQIMIKEILGNESVGQYAAAVRLSEAWYFIPIVIVSSLFPAIVNSKKHSEELYYARMQKLYYLMFAIAFPVALFISFNGEWLIRLLYGAAFNESSSVLIIHIWTGVFVFLGSPTSKWYVSEGLQSYALYRSLFAVISNMILNLMLIPEFGIDGAATATLISAVFTSYFFNVINKKTRINFVLQSRAIFYPFILVGKFFIK
jgi:O-antigen/teichoic acid export membrane protein